MKITRFSLGIRFAAMAEQPHKEFARKIFEGIFSVLTLSELKGLTLYGGDDPFTPKLSEDKESDVYLVVIMGGKLKQMRKVFRAISDDAALDMYMVHDKPFVENNRLYKVEGLNYFGQVSSSGKIEGGDGTLDGLSVPKKHGKRKPVGKGIRVLLAPADYERMSSTDAIKRMTLAARRHFQGVKLAPFPINTGKAGFAESVITATGGAARKISVTSGTLEGKTDVIYGVVSGRTAVLETGSAFGEGGISSQGVGELVRRALDEGLKRIIIGVHDFNMGDGGMGFARSLGIRFYDKDGNELECSRQNLPLIERADAEYLHARLNETEILCMDASAQAEPIEGTYKLTSALGAALKWEFDKTRGFADVVCALSHGKYSRDYEDVLDAINFKKLVKNTALVVTGCSVPDKDAVKPGEPLYAIVKRCAALKIPVAMIVNEVGDGMDELYSMTNAGVMTIGSPKDDTEEIGARRFDSAADRMFRLIRMGRDVEKIGAPKQPRLRPWIALLIESWKK